MSHCARLFCAFTVVAAALPVAAQPLSGVVTPAVANPGQQVTLTVTGVQNVNLPTPCIFQDVHMGSPTGPSVIQILCILLITPLNAGSSLSATWTPFQTGTFWLQVPVVGFPDQFFCVEVRSPASQAPVLSASTNARVGQDLVMGLSAPQLPSSIYVAAASLTSNTGIPLGGSTVCLDQDPIFGLSFPNPDATLFANFAAVTDSAGSASGITVHIPNLPALTWFPLKVQAAVIDPVTLAPALSNGLAFTILP